MKKEVYFNILILILILIFIPCSYAGSYNWNTGLMGYAVAPGEDICVNSGNAQLYSSTIPTSSCTYKLELISLEIDDEGDLYVGGTKVADDYNSCACNCNFPDEDTTGCLDKIWYNDDISSHRNTNGGTSVQMWIKDECSVVRWGKATFKIYDHSCGTTSCTKPHTVGSCTNTCKSSGAGCNTCTPSCSCAAGWNDCDNNMADGCETNGACCTNLNSVFAGNVGDKNPWHDEYSLKNSDDSSISSYTSSACCAESNSCIWGGNCYVSGNIKSTGYTNNKKVLCADNNVVNAGASWIDCDGDRAYHCGRVADTCGYGWDAYQISGETISHGGYSLGSVDGTECCGDDSNENIGYRMTSKTLDRHVSWDDLTTDDACCDKPTDCILDNDCYDDDIGYASITGVSSDFDVFCYNSKWSDVDLSSTRCIASGNDWAEAGELNVGEYGDDNNGGPTSTTKECCGDDNNEHYISSGPGPARCCNSPTDCVDFTGECKPSGTCIEICWQPISSTIPMPGTLYYGDEDINLFSDYDNRDGKVGDPNCLVNVTSVSFFDIN